MATRYLLDIHRGSTCPKESRDNSKCAFSKVTDNAFRAKMIRVADDIGMDPNALAAVIMFETAGTASPSIRNPGGSATGLIQFIAPTATRMGTSVEKLAKMSAVEQLDWVHKFFLPHKGKAYMRTPSEVYAAVFCPSLIGRPMSTVVGRPNDSSVGPCGKYDTIWKMNPFSTGEFTKAQVVGWVDQALRDAENYPRIAVNMSGISLGWVVPLILGAAAGVGVAWGLKELRG
jgi:hypothetical protein